MLRFLVDYNVSNNHRVLHFFLLNHMRMIQTSASKMCKRSISTNPSSNLVSSYTHTWSKFTQMFGQKLHKLFVKSYIRFGLKVALVLAKSCTRFG